MHVDEALSWAARIAREDYDEFVESIEADALKAAINDLILAETRGRPMTGDTDPLAILDTIDGIVDDTHPEGDGCPLCVALDDLRAAIDAALRADQPPSKGDTK